MNAVKLTIHKAVITAIFTFALGAVGLANGTGPAGGDKGTGGGNDANTAAVTYIPAPEGQGLFHIVYNNAKGSRFVLQILDQDGNQLYQNVFMDKKFSRNFQMADPDSYLKLVFVIHNLGDGSMQRYEAETTTHEVEDVDVREVK
jgi:hypothetical protein